MVILGLGSNKGDRLAYLRQAVALLAPVLTGSRISRVYESRALLPEGATREWDLPFLNMAIAGDTQLAPLDLLETVKVIEEQMGRAQTGVWSPREIDIDILAMGEMVLDTPVLSIPHRALLARDFAMLPLSELAPDWHYPVPGDYYRWAASEIVAERKFRCGRLEEEGIAVYAQG